MNIVFICGCLEAGFDGVGDYVRSLAGELQNQGHKVVAIAINDNHVDHRVLQLQSSHTTDLQALRLPACWATAHRFLQAKRFTDEFNPDYISLQFVPFSFHPKGLSISLCRQLNKLARGRNTHIMFHELWVGMDSDSSVKHVLWGFFQKQLIKSLVKTLNPRVIHTQSHLYIFQLSKLKVRSGHLPLFSNIPLLIESANREQNKKKIRFVIFGYIHPNSPVELFVKEAAEYRISTTCEISLTFLGRCGPEMEHWVKVWKAHGLFVEQLGTLTPECISKALVTATIGISTTPAVLVEKSGSVLAMLAHCLPVVLVSRKMNIKGFKCKDLPSGISEYSNGSFSKIVQEKLRSPILDSVAAVARKMADSLSVGSNMEN